MAAVFASVIAAHGRVDIVVNAAGVMLRKAYDETTLEEFDRVVRVNLTGTWLVNREAGKAMTPRGSGRIVNLTTVYAERVGPVPESAYYASKAGVANVTRALAAELGPHGISVNCLAPGVFYPTPMTAALAADPDRLEWFAARTMLGRLGDPDARLRRSPAPAGLARLVVRHRPGAVRRRWLVGLVTRPALIASAPETMKEPR